MLISFDKIFNSHGPFKGVIHIGAHLMQEREEYLSHGLDNTIWIEADPSIYSRIESINHESLKESAFNYLITDIDDREYTFNIADNEGMSSSIFDFDKHLLYHPVRFGRSITLKSKRMDSVINENQIDINSYDFLNIDVQGADLLVLKSFGDLLNNIKYIYIELNKEHLYKDCPLIQDIDEYLEKFKFKRVLTEICKAQWGDGFYVKQ